MESKADVKKIGLITFFKDNYGSILQCYATKRVVEELHYICVVLSEKEERQLKNENFIFRKIKYYKFIIENLLRDPKFVTRWFCARKNPFPLSDESRAMMNAFVSSEICPENYSINEIDDKEYYAFVSGSDQIWNVNNKITEWYFLKFASDYKKIAFSVSLGTDNPSRKFKSIIKKGIKGYNRVSVREESAVQIIKSITGVNVERIADPIIMLSADEWIEFSSAARVTVSNYILVHFLNCPSDIAVNYIEKMRGGCNVVCIAYRYQVFEKMGWDYVECDPREYVAYITAANSVFTDSFHTSLFSINIGKDFYVFERQYVHSHPQTSRISEMLKRYKLEDRLIGGMDEVVTTDVGMAQAVVHNERERAIAFLSDSLRSIVERS